MLTAKLGFDDILVQIYDGGSSFKTSTQFICPQDKKKKQKTKKTTSNKKKTERKKSHSITEDKQNSWQSKQVRITCSLYFDIAGLFICESRGSSGE